MSSVISFSQDCGTHQTVISPLKVNILYRGVTNLVNIAVSGVPSENIRVSIINGNIKEIGKGKYGLLNPTTNS